MSARPLKLQARGEDGNDDDDEEYDSDEGEGRCARFINHHLRCMKNEDGEYPLIAELGVQLIMHPLLILFAFFLIAFAIFFLMYRQGWEIVTAAYVIMQIVTTIGWGDVTVTAQVSQIVMSFVILLMLIVVAKVLSLFLDVLLARQERAARRGLRFLESGFRHTNDQSWQRDYKVKKQWEKINRFIAATLMFFAFIIIGTIFYATVEYCDCSYGVTQIEGCTRGPDRDNMELCIETGGNVKTWINAFYFSVVSLTTVGFGDYSPSSYEGRLFSIPWAILGVLSCGFFITTTSDLLSGEQDPSIIQIGDINEELFRAMDTDNNGFLTKAEFRMWVLLETGLVDRDLVQAIDERYDEIDTCTPGEQEVTWEDVKMFDELWRRKQEETAPEGMPDIEELIGVERETCCRCFDFS